MRMLLGWSLSILLLMSVYAQEPAPSRRAIAFTRATVIDVKNGRPSPDMTIVVVGNRIAALGKTGAVRLPTDAQVIDATGKYLIPGLWDMHLHWAPWETPVLVANGVTGIREMGADCHPAGTDRDCLGEMRLWQKRIETGELGPRLLALSSWPVMARSSWPAKGPRGLAEDLPGFFAASTAEQGRQLARYFAERRVDFIKVSGHLPRDGFLGLAAEARALGLGIAGHEQLAVNAIEAADAGMKSFEHARVFLFNCFPGAETFARSGLNDPDTKWRRRMVDEFDPSICRQVFRTFVRNKTAYVPTHLTRKKLQELVKAGLTPAEALKTATWNGAEFLGRTSESGSVESGKLADLVLLDANPLDDIRNTGKIAALVLNGRYMERSALDQLLRSAEEAANR